ncbi:MAG: RNA polymerase sigma factor [bacterium]|nr:RNA polymerase sigma factor [bacterium]
MRFDDELMRQIMERASAATDAFETLFRRHGEMIRRFVRRIVRDSDAAEDVAQEVFLRVWTRAEQWQGRGPVKAWLYRVAQNLALNSMRSARRHRCESLDRAAEAALDDDDVPQGWLVDAAALGPHEVAAEAERYALVRRLVDSLPDDKREVVRLVTDEDLGAAEAARRLGIPEGTVKSRLHYTTRELATKWKELEKGESE